MAVYSVTTFLGPELGLPFSGYARTQPDHLTNS